MVKVLARSEGEARRLMLRANVTVDNEGGTVVLTAPGGAALSTVTMKAPRLSRVEITTSDGAVDVKGIDGPVDVKSRAGALSADRIQGDCSLATGGGVISVGEIGGDLRCSTGAGHITVQAVKGQAAIQTQGGDISAIRVGGPVEAKTRGGGVHIVSAGGAVTAASGGGEIVVEKAAGVVSAQNMAGPVRVGGAAGVHCVCTGAVQLNNISGSLSVATAMGSIFANLLNSKLADSVLSTGNGDITVMIPSNLRVTIRAANGMADSIRRIVSDFPGVPVRRLGTRVVAEGSVNGGGPLLQINGSGGTIFLRHE
jgi:DUF4097 and DUF4098 domain-containing protein YvlB